MSKVATNNAAVLKPTDFTGLLDAFSTALEEAATKQDVQILRNIYDSFSANTDHDKKAPMDQAFREYLVFKLSNNVELIGKLIRFSVEAVRVEIVSVTIPVVLLGDIFETVTLDKCERIFSYVEDMVSIWKEEIFFTSCKNNILRMCNDLLRRLSRAQNTVFCGRILLFLSKFFPFSERSGLNIVSEFNLDNVTDYGVDAKDLDDALEENTVEDIPIKIDYNLYCKFWSLQDFFRNPNQCYSKAQWKMFQAHSATVLEAFASFKLEETRLSTTKTIKTEVSQATTNEMDVDEAEVKEVVQIIGKKEYFFAKFLTNPKLLALQLSDSNFRRSVLVQFLMLFQYLQLTVKFKTESNTLTAAQTEFIKETETKVYKLLEESPPNGKRFARTVQHMLSREEMWNNWKNDGCKEFKKPEEEVDEKTSDVKPPLAKRPRRNLGDCLREANHQGKFYLGNDVLTRLWNYSPDNLQSCKSEQRNFLPQVETFLESPREKNDPSFEWRALRLLARQSPHFFTLLSSSSYKISDYLEGVRRRIVKDKLEAAKVNTGGSNTTNSQAETAAEINDSEEQVTLTDQVQTQEQDNELDEVNEDHGGEIEKASDDDEKITHAKAMTASREQIEEIAPLIGDDWKKLGKKLGYTADELLFFETEHGNDRDGACIVMLCNWFADDDDATLDNWAYMLEGLEINAAAKAVKALADRLLAQDKQQQQEDRMSE